MNVLAELGAAMIAVWLVVWAMATHQDHARCPPGWWVNGVRPNGSYACLRDRDPDAKESAGHDELHGRLDCAPSFMPITSSRDPRSVACSTIP